MADLSLIGAIRTDGGVLGFKSKMCRTCTTAIYAGQKKFKSDKKIFCSEDCKQEYLDIKRVQSYRRMLEQQKIRNTPEERKRRTEYYRKYRARKVEQLKANKDK